MHVSIWQQFSSNHSASFSVVGTFASPAEANSAAESLLATLKTISDWYSDPANIELVKKRQEDANEAYVYTPPEIALKARYQLNDDTDSFIPVDWIKGGVNEAVHVFENRVFVQNTRDTWSGDRPFPQLLTKLGAESVLVADSFTSSILVNIRCTIPNVQIVDQVRHSIESWQEYLLDTGTIELDGDILSLNGFSADKLYEALPAYIRWLQDLDCAAVNVTFVRDPPSDETEDA